MAQVRPNVSIANMIYTPPSLPDYLSRSHTLNVIVGVPADDEVKAIHDAIRAVNGMSTVPALYDHKLSTQLAQYLFAVQMAVYRNEFPSTISPGENTYTPPSIPSHIPISLEPVFGASSDKELESAGGAVRTLEGLAHSPFFDATLSIKLSQHLFNIQFARYMKDLNQGHFIQRTTSSPSPHQANENEPPIFVSSPPNDPSAQQEFQEVPIILGTSVATTMQERPQSQASSTIVPESGDKLDQVCEAQHETNELLMEIKRTLVSTHLAGIWIQASRPRNAYSTINKHGELPRMRGLDEVNVDGHGRLSRSITVQELAEYLKFYGIGAELIDEETGNLKPNEEGDAKKLLENYLNFGFSGVRPVA
ncbi:hypothetical protein OPQ81_005233 [Rhizoctonia solani]|nr:hypothetical protein OPQ81_005233 [Rhizoctonia solani]